MSQAHELKILYEKEWQRLQALGHEFSREYPQQAAQLNMDAAYDRDPDVEYLMQGCAFLAAQIQKSIRDEQNQVPEQILARLWPQMRQDFPSVSLVQYQPDEQLKETQIFPRGTTFKSEKVSSERMVCEFKTTTDVTVHPMNLDCITCHDAQLDFVFKRHASVKWEDIELDNLDFYIDAQYEKAVYWFMMLSAQVSHLSLDGKPCDGLAINPARQGYENNLRDCFETGFLAQQNLFDYFAFYPKAFFIRLEGLRLQGLGDSMCFTVSCHFKAPILGHMMPEVNHFKLYCTPAINLFEMDAEPIQLDHKHYRYPLTASRALASAVRIVDVIDVQGRVLSNGEIKQYHPIHQRGHSNKNQFSISYDRMKTGAMQLYMSFVTAEWDEETISSRVFACNGNIPHEYLLPNQMTLAKGETHLPIKGINLTRPTPVLNPPNNLSSTLIELLTLHVERIDSANSLKSLLMAMDWSNSPQQRRRIEGIKKLNLKQGVCISKGVMQERIHIRIEADEGQYLSIADGYHFFNVLNQFYQEHAPINDSVQLTVCFTPSQKVFEWQPLSGENKTRF